MINAALLSNSGLITVTSYFVCSESSQQDSSAASRNDQPLSACLFVKFKVPQNHAVCFAAFRRTGIVGNLYIHKKTSSREGS